ncbi:MAG TPA: methyltransferase [Blastocatellia bacterium]|nr:methyltransferase [Blastocatellia bacterium]
MAQGTTQPNLTPQQITEDLWAAWKTQALIAGIELGVFTHISEGKRTAKEIAKAARASLRGMQSLLDALVGVGYLNRKGERYGLEPISERFLVSTKETYMGGMAFSTKIVWDSWGHLAESVRTGRPVQTVDTAEGGREFFPKLVSGIFPASYAAARATVAALPEKARGKIRNILDVAAGSGAWSLAFAQAIPEARVTVIDYPEVTPITRQYVEQFGAADRYDYIEGNLREIDFGRGLYDLVILGHIIHSEGEKWGKRLVKKSHKALNDGGQLLIAEMVPNDARTAPAIPLLFGLNMLLHTDEGGVYTMREYREWLKGSGFRSVRTIDAPAPSPIIMATK